MKHLIFSAAACSLILFAACDSKKTSADAQAPEAMAAMKPLVELAEVEQEPVDQLQTYSATIVGEVKNNIAPASPARITRIYAEVGDRVRVGQRLVEMDKTSLNSQKMQLQNLETEFDRINELYAVGGVSQSEWESMKLQVEVMRATLGTLEENTILVSPINGVVTARNYDNGDLYSGQPVLVVQTIDPVKLTVNVSEQYYSKVQKGDEVSIELDAYPGETFTAKVSLIYPTVDAMTHTFPVELIVKNSDLKLRPGMFARATMNLGTENHIVVPDIAIVKRAGSGDRYVYVYESGRVNFCKVELGQRMGDRYELISGVPNGAKIVVSGQAKLSDGKEVEVKE